MKMLRRLLMFGLFNLILIFGGTNPSNGLAENHINQQRLSAKLPMQQLIIKFRNANFDPSQGDYLQKLSRDIKVTLVYLGPMSGGAYVIILESVSSTNQLAAIIRQLSERPEISYVEQDNTMKHQQDK